MKTEIKILHASCCSKNDSIRKQIESLLKSKEIEAEIQDLTELSDTMVYGTMTFPSIVINGIVYDYKQYSTDEKLLAIL